MRYGGDRRQIGWLGFASIALFVLAAGASWRPKRAAAEAGLPAAVPEESPQPPPRPVQRRSAMRLSVSIAAGVLIFGGGVTAAFATLARDSIFHRASTVPAGNLVTNPGAEAGELPATLWALEAGVDLALANKESLVAAGELALAAHGRGGGLLIPVDSEHSAAFQCLDGRAAELVDSLVLTASGGPFRGRTRDQLEHATVEDALAHPTWSMGPKITVDSATLANKGLELIEAHFLFGLEYERIEVVVHPGSIVHALVRFRDGAALAHLGYPDMRVPISYALTYPERAATPLAPLALAGLTLEFEQPDLETFPLLALAREAGERGGTYPCAFNAANEVAVAAFLAGRLPFLGIGELVERALAAVEGTPARDLDDLVEADAQARRAAEEALVPA